MSSTKNNSEIIKDNQGQIAFIAIRISSVTKDSITVGLIYISPLENKVLISEERMKLVKKIIKPHLYNHFKYAIDGYKKSKDKMTTELITRQHVYQNGIIKISQLSPIHLPEEYTLEDFFKKTICESTLLK